MRKKITTIFLTLALIAATLVFVPGNNKVKAVSGDGEQNMAKYIDYPYIYDKIKNMSNIVFSDWKGRDFGEYGEQQAAIDIENWMNDIDLYNVTKENITEHWRPRDGNWDCGGYCGPLDRKRVRIDTDDTKFYLNVSVYWVSNETLKEYKNFTVGENAEDKCFPHFRSPREWEKLRYRMFGKNKFGISEQDLTVVDTFYPLLGENQLVVRDLNWTDPWNYNIPLRWLPRPQFRGFILADCFDNTIFMGPSVRDHHVWVAGHWPKPGFSINGSNGKWIHNATGNNSLEVKADFCAMWEYNGSVDSSNVIGQINGTDTGNVSIICAHYDCWWNQGAIDEGAETALFLGIAKYIKALEENGTIPEHTLKFIAYAGEELLMRGSKDYIKKHILDESENESVKYVINPGNFGHNHSGYNYTTWWGKKEWKDILFEPASSDNDLSQLVVDITDAIGYTEKTGFKVNQCGGELGAEDSKVFYKANASEDVIQFRRSPFKGYHRDGNSHLEGDVLKEKGEFSGLHNRSFSVESDVVLLTTLHLCMNVTRQFADYNITPFDSDSDGDNDSVNVTFSISSNIPSWTKVGGYIYNTSSNKTVSDVVTTDLITVNQSMNASGNFTLRLWPDQPPDNYDVRLKLYDFQDNLDDTGNETVYLHPYGSPVAAFHIGTSGGKTYTFHDDSHPSYGVDIINWTWNFGDGNYSYQQNPGHTYGDDGTYNITLTILDNNNLSDNITKQLSVTNDLPVPQININSNVKVVTEPCMFQSGSSDNDGQIVNWTWNFGDGSVSYDENPVHSYPLSDFYTVALTVRDDDGATATATQEMIIAGALTDDNFVDDGRNHKWDTVQESINDVRDGDIVYTYNGDYSEGIVVDKKAILYGESIDNVKISADGIGVDIKDDSAYLEGFTISGGETGILVNRTSGVTILNCTVLNSTYGIKIEGNSQDNTISHCNLTNNTYGVYIYNSTYNLVGSLSVEEPLSDCVFTLNDYGIYLDNSDSNQIIGCTFNETTERTGPPTSTTGICMDNSNENTVAFCEVFNSSNYGIYLGGSDNNTISNCYIRENDKGVYLTGSMENSIVENNFSNNYDLAVDIFTISSTSNYIGFNDFINNGNGPSQARDDGSDNYWNSTGNRTMYYSSFGEGNHWSDYNGNDSDGNGIGDTSYPIIGTAMAMDGYPVMKAYGWCSDWR